MARQIADTSTVVNTYRRCLGNDLNDTNTENNILQSQTPHDSFAQNLKMNEALAQAFL